MGLWVLGALPLLLLALSNDWCITPPGLIDPWVYFGYYQDLPQHLTSFDGTYYGTRLSALLPGYAAYHCLPPLAANYVLHLGLYYACVVSLYWILALTISVRAGLLAAVCLGCHFFFLRAIGWDYVNGFGIAYFLLSALALTAATRTTFWKGNLVAAGMNSAALVIANTFYGVFLPYLAIHYLYLNRRSRRNPLLRGMGLYLLGVSGLILALCLLSWLVAGRFWFLGPTLHFAHTFAGQTNPWKVPISTWLPMADWLVLPALTALGSLAFCNSFRYPQSGKKGTVPRSLMADSSLFRGMAVFYQGQFLFTLIMMIGWEWWGQPILQLQEYASLLLPATLLALGAQLALHVERLSRRQFGALLAMVLLASLAPYALNNAGEWPTRLSRWSAALTLAGGTLGLAVLTSRRPGALAAAGIIVLFVSIPACLAWHTFDFSEARPRIVSIREESPRRREHYHAADILCSVFDAARVVRKWDPAGQTRFWYDARAPMGKVCTAVASTYLWGYRLVNTAFPAVGDPAEFARLKGHQVLILSADVDALAKANASMKELGMEASLLAEQHIAYPSVAFTMYKVTIKTKGSLERPLRARFEQAASQGTLIASPPTGPAPEDHVPLPLDQWHSCYDPPKMSLARTEQGLQVATPVDRWGYAALYSPLRVVEEGNYRFDLKYSLRHGDIAFGALSEDQSRWLGQAGPGSKLPEKPGMLVKSFNLCLKAGESFRLLLTNNYPGGSHSSQVVIHEVRAVREISMSHGNSLSR
jgi:hypothetical protein